MKASRRWPTRRSCSRRRRRGDLQQRIVALHGVSLDGRARRDRGAARRQRRRQDHAPQGGLEPAAAPSAAQVTAGAIHFDGSDVAPHAAPPIWSARGLVQVLEGRHCFRALTVEENLLTGGHRRAASAAPQRAARARAGLRASSRASTEKRAIACRPDLGRRAADDGDRPRADGAPAPAPARRAVDGPGPADRRRRSSSTCASSTAEGLSHPGRRAERAP